ncbi:MAG: hypothetical protein JWQ64_1552 [Subtercola sp.]|nr:hypothetical protein [Subtercola sp.]
MTIEPPPPGPPLQPGPPMPPGDPYGSPHNGPPSPYTAQPSADKTNVLAIVSLILGIVSYFTGFVLAIGAVITGHIALSQIKKTGVKGRGMAIAGLILGYVGILFGIIAVVVFIILFAVIGVASNNINNSLVHPTFSNSPDDGSNGGSAQSTDAACSILNGEVSDSATALNDNFSQLESDPTAAVAALQTLSDDFSTAESKITNPDVLEAATQANSDLETMISDIQAFIANPAVGSDAIVSDSQAVQTSFSAIAKVCP